MTTRPDASVIIPTRDALQSLPATIESIGGRASVEILIVDDGSTDGTLAWLGELALSDPRVRFMHGARSGQSRARNLAIGAARAPLIAFLDAGDRWLPGKLDEQLAFHDAHPEIGFSFTDHRHVPPCGKKPGSFAMWPRFGARCAQEAGPFLLDRSISALYAENVVAASTVVARTCLVQQAGGFNTGLSAAEEWDLWMTLARLAPVGVLPAVLAETAGLAPGLISARMDTRVMAMRVIAERHRAVAVAEDPSAEKGFNAQMCATRAEIAAAGGKRLKSLALRAQALAYQPGRRTAADLVGALYAPQARSVCC